MKNTKITNLEGALMEAKNARKSVWKLYLASRKAVRKAKHNLKQERKLAKLEELHNQQVAIVDSMIKELKKEGA